MTSSVLAELLARRPFRPFDLWLPDLFVLTVSSPDQIRYVPGSRTLTNVKESGHELIIDLDLVAAIEVHPEERR